MNEKYIKSLIRLVEESEIESLEVSSWGRKIRITQKAQASANGHQPEAIVVQAVAPQPIAAAPQPAAAPTPAPPAETNEGLVEINSPMVGTFYAAPAPDADPYVSLNEKISVGQVVCIVEAMKLMNEIEAEAGGRIVKMLAENGKPVEFGQPLFMVDPNG